MRSGYQSLVLGSIASGSFVSLWELSNVPLVSSHPPQRVGDFFTQGGTTFSYRDEIILTDELLTAFNEPEDLRLVVTMADGSNVFRALEITPIPEPSITLLALASLCILGMRKRRSNR